MIGNISIKIENEIVSSLVYKEFEDFYFINFISLPEYDCLYNKILFSEMNKNKAVILLQNRDWNLKKYKDHYKNLGFELSSILNEKLYFKEGGCELYNSGFIKYIYEPK